MQLKKIYLDQIDQTRHSQTYTEALIDSSKKKKTVVWRTATKGAALLKTSVERRKRKYFAFTAVAHSNHHRKKCAERAEGKRKQRKVGLIKTTKGCHSDDAPICEGGIHV